MADSQTEVTPQSQTLQAAAVRLGLLHRQYTSSVEDFIAALQQADDRVQKLASDQSQLAADMDAFKIGYGCMTEDQGRLLMRADDAEERLAKIERVQLEQTRILQELKSRSEKDSSPRQVSDIEERASELLPMHGINGGDSHTSNAIQRPEDLTQDTQGAVNGASTDATPSAAVAFAADNEASWNEPGNISAISDISDDVLDVAAEEATGKVQDDISPARRILRERKVRSGPYLDEYGSIRLDPFDKNQSLDIYRGKPFDSASSSVSPNKMLKRCRASPQAAQDIVNSLDADVLLTTCEDEVTTTIPKEVNGKDGNIISHTRSGNSPDSDHPSMFVADDEPTRRNPSVDAAPATNIPPPASPEISVESYTDRFANTGFNSVSRRRESLDEGCLEHDSATLRAADSPIPASLDEMFEPPSSFRLDNSSRRFLARVIEPTPTPPKQATSSYNPVPKWQKDLYRDDWITYGKPFGIPIDAYVRQRTNEPLPSHKRVRSGEVQSSSDKQDKPNKKRKRTSRDVSKTSGAAAAENQAPVETTQSVPRDTPKDRSSTSPPSTPEKGGSSQSLLTMFGALRRR